MCSLCTIVCREIEQNERTCIFVVELLYYLIYINGQVAWLIIGHKHHYREDTIQCRESYEDARVLWNYEMVIIALGYVLFVAYVLIVGALGFLVGYNLYKCFKKCINGEQP